MPTVPPNRGPSFNGPQIDLPALLARMRRRGLLLLVLALPLAVAGYWWFVQRIEVDAGELLVLVHRFGDPLPTESGDQVVIYPALLKQLGDGVEATDFKGIMYDVLPEGRYFYDPFLWERRIVQNTYIAPDEVGILIRKYGEPLPTGKVVATEPDERGPVLDVLPKGRHNINPFAYDVVRVKRKDVPEGSVGVRTLIAGRTPANPNRYIVDPGESGVQPDVLPPGLYDINPYAESIEIIDVRSHNVDFRDVDAIRFPSKDSFDILVEGTVEYAIRQDRAAYVCAAIGDHDDIRTKLIMPYMRSLARIEGSKLEAREFISGDTRKAFQDRVFEGLRRECNAQGIEIRATLIRRIEPPNEIAEPISLRQVAAQQEQQYHNEIRLAESEARLAEQKELQKQNQEVGAAQRDVVGSVVDAEQREAVALLEANQRLEVARLNLEAAREDAAATVARGRADADVVLLQYEAEAEPLRDAIAAFGGGSSYAQHFFFKKLAPSVRSVLASTDGPFSDIFKSLSSAVGSAPTRAEPLPGASGGAAGGAGTPAGGAAGGAGVPPASSGGAGILPAGSDPSQRPAEGGN